MATQNATNNTLSTATAITISSGDLTLSSGNINLPNASSTIGQIQWNSVVKIHNYGTRNFFAGGAGNFTLTTGTAVDNTGIGDGVMTALTTGLQNAACGSGAMHSINSQVNSCALGYNAMNLATSGSNNSAFGSLSLSALTTGSYNTCLGYNSGSAYTSSESSNICVMNTGTLGESNVMRIGTDGSGNGQVSSTYIAGIANATVTGSAVLVSTSGQLGLAVSSRRFKEDIQDMADSSSPIMKLRPVTFIYNFDEEKKKQFGLIAEEVLEIMPELVGYNDKGEINTVHYHLMPAILLNEMQKQQKLIDELEAIITTLEGRANV